MERMIYGLLGFAIGVLVVSIIGVFWSDYRDKKSAEKDEYNEIDEISREG